jgi:two-component system, response regulator YesN
VGVKMKKVLIVDDELLVQVGLKSMINWEEHGLTVVGDAKNGQEAIDIFERVNPHIVFVDIAMPVMNGFELIKVLKKKKPSVKTCILTSHTDFNYVKEAASLNVCEYLLKSELTRDSLAKCINNIVSQIDTETSAESTTGTSAAVYPEQLVEDDLFKVITGFFKSKEEMNSIIDKYKFRFRQNLWFISVALIMVNHTDMERYQKDPNHFKSVIMSLSKQVFSERDFTVYSTIIEDKIIFLYSIDMKEDISSVKEKIINLLYLLKNNLKQFLNIDLYIGLSGSTKSFTQLSELYKQAYNAKEYCFFESDKIALYDEGLFREKGNMLKVNYKTIEKLLLKGDIEELEKNLQGIFEQLYSCKNKEYIRTVFIDLLSQAKVFAEHLLNKQSNITLTEEKFNYNAFQQLHTFKAVRDYIINIYKEVIRIEKNQGEGQYSYTIQKSIEYIKRNYWKNITLSDVAEYAEVSKNYLSFLFKQEIKTNFSIFLLNFRIDKSKELLTNGNAKIYEIANLVGFENPYYFSKVFREIVGVSCKEYQKLYYKNNQGANV